MGTEPRLRCRHPQSRRPVPTSRGRELPAASLQQARPRLLRGMRHWSQSVGTPRAGSAGPSTGPHLPGQPGSHRDHTGHAAGRTVGPSRPRGRCRSTISSGRLCDPTERGRCGGQPSARQRRSSRGCGKAGLDLLWAGIAWVSPAGWAWAWAWAACTPPCGSPCSSKRSSSFVRCVGECPAAVAGSAALPACSTEQARKPVDCWLHV